MDRLRRSLDLGLIVLLAAAGLAVQLLAVPPIARALAGGLLVVVCPGYALTAALFTGRSLGEPERAMAERLALSVGLSLALTMLSAIVLNALGWSIAPRLWAAVLAGLTLAASLLALARRLISRAAPAPARPRAGRPLGVAQWALLASALLITLGAFALERVPRPTTNVIGYSALWLLPVGADSSAVSLGIASSELTTTTYQLELTVDGSVIEDWPNLTLAPGEQWQQRVTLPSGHASGAIEAVLFRADQPHTVYRRVMLKPAT